MSKMKIKKGDTVVLLTGKYKDKYVVDEKKADADKSTDVKRRTGKVLEVSAKEGKVIVEGINMVTKHVKPTKAGQEGGIVKAEAPIYACKVMAVCPKCGKPTRVGFKKDENGKSIRICKKCNAEF